MTVGKMKSYCEMNINENETQLKVFSKEERKFSLLEISNNSSLQKHFEIFGNS